MWQGAFNEWNSNDLRRHRRWVRCRRLVGGQRVPRKARLRFFRWKREETSTLTAIFLVALCDEQLYTASGPRSSANRFQARAGAFLGRDQYFQLKDREIEHRTAAPKEPIPSA